MMLTARRHCCLVCFGLFLVFQQNPGDTSPTPDAISDEESDIQVNPVCQAGCVSCSTYNGCVTCHGTHFLFLQWHGIRQTGQCFRKCPAGYYGRRTKGQGKCFKCEMENCTECANQSTCVACITPLLIANGRCVAECPKSRPHPTEKGVCQRRINCGVGNWSQWGPCIRDNATCNSDHGCRFRQREILQSPSPNGRKCPPAIQSKDCRRNLLDTTNESDPPQGEDLDEFSDTRKKKRMRCDGQDEDDCKEKNKNKKKRKQQQQRQQQDGDQKPPKSLQKPQKMTPSSP